MSRNNSYIKSMNGIVSFDSNGTTIEGDKVTSGTIDCTNLNATDVKATGSLNTSYIFVDYMDKNVNEYITFISDVLFDYKLFVSNLWPAVAGPITLNGSLTVSDVLRTASLEAKGGASIYKKLKIGQDNDYTDSIYIGRAEQIVLGTVYPAIPPRTTFYAVDDDDIANKKYVDTVTGGVSILTTTNIFTGASNTFNNVINTSQIDSVIPSSTYNLLTSHTGALNIGSVASVISMGSITTSQIDSVTPSSTYNLLTSHTGALNIGSVASVISMGSISVPIRSAYIPLITTDLCNKSYVDSVATSIGTSLLASINTWTGTSNTFDNTTYFGPSTGSQISISGSALITTVPTQSINIFTDCTSTLNIGNKSNSTPTQINIGRFLINNNTIEPYNVSANLNIFTTTESTSTITIGKYRMQGYSFGPNLNTDCSLFTALTTRILTFGPSSGQLIMPTTNIISLGPNIKIQTTSIFSDAINSTINLFNNITTGTINLGNSLTTGLLQFGGGKIKIGNQQISGYTSYNNISTGNFTIPSTINIEYFIVVSGTTPRVITLPATPVGAQIINLRNASASTSHQITTFPSTTIGIYPTQAGSGYFQPAWSMPASTSQRFYFDGSNWIGF